MVGDVQVPLTIANDGVEDGESGFEGGAAVTGIAAFASAGEGVDDAFAVDTANLVIDTIGDDELSMWVDGDAAQLVEDGVLGGDFVAVKAFLTIARVGRLCSGRRRGGRTGDWHLCDGTSASSLRRSFIEINARNHGGIPRR